MGSRLVKMLITMREATIPELERIIYDIPKRSGDVPEQHKIRQREFFKHVYQLLLDKDQGPRLPTFLWAADRVQMVKLLDFV